MKCTWLSGRMWISRSTSNSPSPFARINRKRFKFRPKDKPCDSTCSGVELSLLVDSSSSRLGIFLRERNATITEKAGKKAFGGTRYEKISGMVEGPFSTRDRTNTIKEVPIYQSSLEKNEAFRGFWDSFWDFSRGYLRWWKKTVPSSQAWMSSLQSSWKTKWRPTVPSLSCKLVLILERLREEIDLKIAEKMILIVKELFNSTKLRNCWLISWISGLVWKADGASTTRFVEGPSIFEVFYVDHDAD